MSNELLRVSNLKKHFKLSRGRVVKAVDDVSFTLNAGETLGIVGESGCGKTTLGRTVIRIYEPTSGTVEFDGQTLDSKAKNFKRELSDKMQMIFQDPYASLNPRMTVGDIIAEGWDFRRKYSAGDKKSKVIELLQLVGLNAEHANRFPHEFSGGQRQRIGIARALSMDPKLIICDEPISALDVSIQAQVMNLLIELQQKFGLTYMFIAHDLSMVRYISNNILVMYLGAEVEFGKSNDVYHNPLHPYTKALFSAIPIPNPTAEKSRSRIMLTGDIPSPMRAPSGCKFHTRCPYAKDICANEVPPKVEVHAAHFCACHFAKEINS